jgi:dTDP-4-dehydrorhamnose reductase
MKVLVTGREGQLVRSLVERARDRPGLEVVTAGRPAVDLEQPGSLRAAVRAAAPDLVINAAAYTAVDQAEREPERAFRINADAAGEAAAAARETGARIIQLSTDYVFDGTGTRPWRPDDGTAPLGVYGASKLAGEEQVRAGSPQHLIVRTAWVYSPFGRNFVRTMLRLAAERDEVRVVADQRGGPTNALDLADGLLHVASAWASGSDTGLGRTMHFAGQEPCSWAVLGEAVFAASARLDGPSARVVPIGSADYPTPAQRPANSVLDCRDFEVAFGWPMPRWRSSLGEVVRRLLAAP